MPFWSPSGCVVRCRSARSPRVEGNALSSTASFGVAQYRQGDTGEDLLRLADDALYRAKGEGKNRVCVAREGRAA